MVDSSLEGIEPLEVRDIAFCGKATSHQEEAAPGDASILGLDFPLVLVEVELSSDHLCLEFHVLPNIKDLVNMIKVSSQLFPPWILLGPRPILPDFWHGIFIDRNVRVYPRAGVAIPVPRPSQVGPGFIDLAVVAELAEVVEQENTAKASADDERIVFRTRGGDATPEAVRKKRRIVEHHD